jgi:hypothetical protein
MMSVAHCLPLPSSDPRVRWLIVVILILVAASSPQLAAALGFAASAVTVVGIEGSRKGSGDAG